MADRFERYTKRAREALQYAQEESITLDHLGIGTSHLLLGVVRSFEGRFVPSPFQTIGVTSPKLRATVAEILWGTPVATTPGISQALKGILDYAPQIAGADFNPNITIPIIFGLLSQDPEALKVLESLSPDLPDKISEQSFIDEIAGKKASERKLDTSEQMVAIENMRKRTKDERTIALIESTIGDLANRLRILEDLEDK